MEIFLNEWSLQLQYAAIEQFELAAIELIALVSQVRLVLQRGRGSFFRSDRLDQRHAVGADHFLKSVGAIPDKEIRETLLDVVYNKTDPAPWEASRCHNPPDAYHWIHYDVTDTSMAEAAERLLSNTALLGCLLNFDASPLQGQVSISVLKNALQPGAAVPCFETAAAFDGWISTIRGAMPYGETDVERPIDEQTCLVDRARFEPTGRRQQGRLVFEERTTRDLYYVDNLHFGRGAHLEVFSRHGVHKGEASLDGIIKEGTRDKNKKLE